MIYFTSCTLRKTIHAGPLGFTQHIYRYSTGKDKEQAADRVWRWLEAHKLKPKRLSTDLAINQDPASYTFPEQIIGSVRVPRCIHCYSTEGHHGKGEIQVGPKGHAFEPGYIVDVSGGGGIHMIAVSVIEQRCRLVCG